MLPFSQRGFVLSHSPSESSRSWKSRHIVQKSPVLIVQKNFSIISLKLFILKILEVIQSNLVKGKGKSSSPLLLCNPLSTVWSLTLRDRRHNFFQRLLTVRTLRSIFVLRTGNLWKCCFSVSTPQYQSQLFILCEKQILFCFQWAS